MRRGKAQNAVQTEDVAKVGIANAGGILQHTCKHRLKIAGETADNLKYLRCRCLLV
jgi:hypothetical protein